MGAQGPNREQRGTLCPERQTFPNKWRTIFSFWRYSVVRSWKGIGKIGIRFEYLLWWRDDALDLEDIDGVMLRKDAKVEVPENDLVVKTYPLERTGLV